MFFIAWISFVPEPMQFQYKGWVYFLLVLCLIAALYKHRFSISQYFFQKCDFAFWLYLLLISVNIWFGKDKKTALNFYKDFSTAAILVYFLIKNGIDARNIKKVLYFLCICAGVVSIFGIMEMFMKVNIIYEKYVNNFFYQRFLGERMMSTLMHPNILGAYLISTAPLAYYFYKSKDSPRIKYFNLVIFALIICAIFLTFSRGTYLAVLFMLSVWFWVKRKKKWLVAIWLIALLLSFISQLSVLGDNINYRFGLKNLWDYLKYGHRTINYFVSWNMFKTHPFVGIGLSHYRMLFDHYVNFQLDYEVMIPDSIYLMHLAETGLIGIIGLVVLLLYLLKNALVTYKKIVGDNKELLFAILMSFVALLINMATFDGLLWKTTFYLFWVLLSILNVTEKMTLEKYAE